MDDPLDIKSKNLLKPRPKLTWLVWIPSKSSFSIFFKLCLGRRRWLSIRIIVLQSTEHDDIVLIGNNNNCALDTDPYNNNNVNRERK